MPAITVKDQTVPIEGENAEQYLQDHGILYEHWDIRKADQDLAQQPILTDSEKEALIAPFLPDINRLASEYSYVSHDLIVLNRDATPDLDTMLENFQREHHHHEDEVRFIVAGEGIFTLTRAGDTFSVRVTPGDLISVPDGTRHWFTLTDTLNVKAIRLFQTQSGWEAIYDPDQA